MDCHEPSANGERLEEEATNQPRLPEKLTQIVILTVVFLMENKRILIYYNFISFPIYYNW